MTDENSINIKISGSNKHEENGVFQDDKKLELEKEAADRTDEDPWALPELKDNSIPWNMLSGGRKFKRVLFILLKVIILLGLLYMFVCSLDFLSSAFRLVGGKAAGRTFANNELLKNPVAGLMIGVLATVLVQSSSTSTSIVVTMVASGIMHVSTAIPIIMGANVGTSVTNTIVAMGHISDREEFRRAFAGATVHDMFNWLNIIILLPIEVFTGYLYHLSKAIVDSMDLKTYTSGKKELLKAITKPFTGLIIQIDNKVIEEIAQNKPGAEEKSFMKIWCKYNETKQYFNKTVSEVKLVNGVNQTIEVTKLVSEKVKIPLQKCKYIFINVAGNWSDALIGGILLLISLVILCLCLVFIVKTLNSLLRGRIAVALKKFINADFPKVPFLTGYVAILLGAGMTILVQSSSIFTSTLTPLVGVGVLSLERMYPLTLGSNIGTTATGLLASLAASGDKLPKAMQVAFSHLFINITGIVIFYPIPFMRKIPINLAKFLGMRTSKYKWFAIMYLFSMFFMLPAVVFGLSLAGWYVLAGVGGPIILVVLIILIVKLIQAKKPSCLPGKLQNWKFLPEFMRSLAPYDRVLQKLICCNRCKGKEDTKENGDLSTKSANGQLNLAFTGTPNIVTKF